jgi:hypothetical protein
MAMFFEIKSGAYCDGYGFSYATTSKIQVTSYVSIATQRLRVLLYTQYNFNCWKFLGNQTVEIRSNAVTTLRQGVFSPGRQYPTSGAAE